jgi:outer membrane protein assembly factor BamB
VPPDVPRLRRAFHYAVDAESIFVFGNGFLFALNPATGAVKWMHDINSSRPLKSTAVSLNHALVLPAGGERVALLGILGEASNPLVSVTGGKNAVVKVLRTDLDFGRDAVTHEGSIYCFTAEPLKPTSP